MKRQFLIKSSDFFTDAAEKIGIFLGMPAFLVGVTIVSIGTSLPELASSVIAVIYKSTEIVAGNVIGSNITNILLVLGISAIIGKKLKITWELVHVDLPLLVGSAFLIYLMALDGAFTFFEGIILILGYSVYLNYVVSMQKKHNKKKKKIKQKLGWKTPLMLIISCVFIYIGARYTIESVIELSKLLDIGTEIMALTAIAIGTSLPELTVSIMAAKKGKPELAIGNVLGSNIFNSFAVIGVPALFGTLIVPQNLISFAFPVMIAATLLYFFITQYKEVVKWEGWLLVLIYIFFIGKILGII